jgi:hypothetical protein
LQEQIATNLINLWNRDPNAIGNLINLSPFFLLNQQPALTLLRLTPELLPEIPVPQDVRLSAVSRHLNIWTCGKLLPPGLLPDQGSSSFSTVIIKKVDASLASLQATSLLSLPSSSWLAFLTVSEEGEDYKACPQLRMI